MSTNAKSFDPCQLDAKIFPSGGVAARILVCSVRSVKPGGGGR